VWKVLRRAVDQQDARRVRLTFNLQLRHQYQSGGEPNMSSNLRYQCRIISGEKAIRLRLWACSVFGPPRASSRRSPLLRGRPDTLLCGRANSAAPTYRCRCVRSHGSAHWHQLWAACSIYLYFLRHLTAEIGLDAARLTAAVETARLAASSIQWDR
jgi:hypothetical protein